ncbi:MAG: hypothetical protein HKL84_01405 [Acidimicrobiaceae bacterium]|nr:hypothetical protein [Acidimicrobiaceae bacterium]
MKMTCPIIFYKEFAVASAFRGTITPLIFLAEKQMLIKRIGDGTHMAKVGVLFGGVSPEHDISILTGLQAVRGLESTLHEVIAIYWAKTGEFYQTELSLEAKDFSNGVPSGAIRLSFSLQDGFIAHAGGIFSKSRGLDIEVVVVCLHGGAGEDGSVQAVLDLAGIAYTGPGSKGAAVGMDKLAFGGLLLSHDVPTLPRKLLTESVGHPGFEGPYIVKPRYGGSSIGIEVVADFTTALARLKLNVHFRQGAVIEPYRPDLFDLQVAVRSYPVFELSAIERPVRSGANSEILSYADKYVAGEGMVAAPRELPAVIPDSLADSLRNYARIIGDILPVRGLARIDFLSDGVDILYVNEVNTIPGSLSKYLFISPPISFEKLLGDLIDEAASHKTYMPVTAGADGSALASAGSIAAKLA